MNFPLARHIADPRRLRLATVLTFAASFIVYAVSPAGRPLHKDLLQGAETMLVSFYVDRDGTFANPFFWIQTGPTAHTAPAYILLHALVGNLFGLGLEGARVLWALNVGFLSLQLALLPAVAVELGLGAATGVLAAILAVVAQPYRVEPEWEALLTGALLVVLLLLTLKHFKKKSGEPWRLLPLGLLWGGAILTNPECVLLLFVWSFLVVTRSSPETGTRAWGELAWVVAGAAVACLPWTVRNYQQLHSIFFVRDNFGIELYTSNNPCAQPGAYENVISGCHWLTHPYGNRTLAMEVLERGEIRFNQDMLRRALGWIRSNPRVFAWLTARRFVRFWFPGLGGWRYSIPMGILTALSLFGVAWMRGENRWAAQLLTATLLIYPLVHYVVQFEARYRYPIYWATTLPAAYALIQILRWRRRPGPAITAMHETEPEMSIAS